MLKTHSEARGLPGPSRCQTWALLEIANTTEAGPDGRIDVGQVNIIFLREGGNPDDYRAGIERLKADGIENLNDKSKREGGTFSRSDLRYDPRSDIYHCAGKEKARQQCRASSRSDRARNAWT